MIGLDIFASNYFHEGTTIKDILRVVFSELLPSVVCCIDEYELMRNNEAMGLNGSMSPAELVGIFGEEGVTLICGRFFCYTEKQRDRDFETFEGFTASGCQTVILVIDVGYVEVYSKDEDYLLRCLKALNGIEGTVNVECVQLDTCGRQTFQIW